MTGHHGLQEQPTPPHKDLCVQTSHHSTVADSFWFLLPCSPIASLSVLNPIVWQTPAQPWEDQAWETCMVTCVSTSCPSYSLCQHFTASSSAEDLGREDGRVFQRAGRGGREGNFAFSQQSTETQSGVTWGHTECPALFIKPPSSCHWKREAERCLATAVVDAS